MRALYFLTQSFWISNNSPNLSSGSYTPHSYSSHSTVGNNIASADTKSTRCHNRCNSSSLCSNHIHYCSNTAAAGLDRSAGMADRYSNTMAVGIGTDTGFGTHSGSGIAFAIGPGFDSGIGNSAYHHNYSRRMRQTD